MSIDQLVSFLVEIADTEPADALIRMDREVEFFLAENRHLPSWVALNDIVLEFQTKSDKIDNDLSMEMLKKLADRIPLGY